jgi:hypothetical protein
MFDLGNMALTLVEEAMGDKGDGGEGGQDGVRSGQVDAAGGIRLEGSSNNHRDNVFIIDGMVIKSAIAFRSEE